MALGGDDKPDRGKGEQKPLSVARGSKFPHARLRWAMTTAAFGKTIRH